MRRIEARIGELLGPAQEARALVERDATVRARPALGLRLSVVAAPTAIDSGRLSPGARETAAHISTRIAAGYSYDEVAAMLQEARPAFKHLTAPAGPITKAWVAARTRELRAEIAESGAATY